MIEHRNKSKCPFKIGQLVRYKDVNPTLPYRGLFLVLDLEWNKSFEEWTVILLSQQRGHQNFAPSVHIRTIEENND